MFKVLRHLLGKLLIVYHSAVFAALFASLLLIMSNLLFAPGSQTLCQVFVHGYSLTYMLYEGIGTVVSAQVYYLMYRDYKNMADISPTWSDQLFEHYIMFSFAPMIPMAILTIGFDFTARIGNETILPTGHCILPPTNLYESLFLAYMYILLSTRFVSCWCSFTPCTTSTSCTSHLCTRGNLLLTANPTTL